MAGRLPEHWLNELRERADILSVVSDYVQLKQTGGRFWGLCPFHTEKTPSFTVSPERQAYYCFGCQASGSSISFIMQIERMDFIDAVKHIADKLNIPMPEYEHDPNYKQRRSLQEIIYKLNTAAAKFYHEALWKDDALDMRSYLYKRGLDDATIRRFGLGAAPPGWDRLTQEMLSQGYDFTQLKEAGLAVEKEGRQYDMFRQRVIFPIIDARSRVLGFGGRLLGDGRPKYLNSPDTKIFSKRENLYGLKQLERSRGDRSVYLVEGYMDAVSLSRNGIKNAVATLGTALTQKQARLLKRYADTVLIAYDGDAAGRAAILKAIDILTQEDIPCRVIDFPEGQDPDDYIRKHGMEAFTALPAISAIHYRMRRAMDGLDITQSEGRMQYAIACAQILREVKQPVELEEHLRRLSVETSFPREVLLQQIGQAPQPGSANREAARMRASPKSIKGQASFEPDHIKAERMLLGILATGRHDISDFDEEMFSTPAHKRVFARLSAGIQPAVIIEEIEDEETRGLAAQALFINVGGDDENLPVIIRDCVDRIRIKRIEQEISALDAMLTNEDPQKRREALKQIQKTILLKEELKRLQAGRKEWSV